MHAPERKDVMVEKRISVTFDQFSAEATGYDDPAAAMDVIINKLRQAISAGQLPQNDDLAKAEAQQGIQVAAKGGKSIRISAEKAAFLLSEAKKRGAKISAPGNPALDGKSPDDVSLKSLITGEDAAPAAIPEPTGALLDTTMPDGGFYDFADELQPRDLSETIEAAAAYLTYIEARTSFSRPDIMNKLRGRLSLAFDQDKAVEAFSKLLIEDHIRHVGEGRYRVTEKLTFLPED
jgi:hypothetical protein